MNLSEVVESLHRTHRYNKRNKVEWEQIKKKLSIFPVNVIEEYNKVHPDIDRVSIEESDTSHANLEKSCEAADEIYADRSKWKWFELGECSSTYNILPEDDLFRCSKSENLPFSHTAISGYFENTGKYESLQSEVYFYTFAKRITERGDCVLLTAISSNSAQWVTTRASLIKDFDTNEWRYCPQNEDDNFDNVGRIAAKLLLATLKILQCKNVYIHTESFPERLNKRRKREGKVLGYAKCTIQIKNEEKTIGVSNNQESTGVHQRLHFRRGHIRRLPKGNIWVRECYAGRANIGTLDKGYEVHV